MIESDSDFILHIRSYYLGHAREEGWRSVRMGIGFVERLLSLAESPPRWIKCSERMPEENCCVIVLHADGVDEGYWYGGNVRWVVFNEEDPKAVTHWMPLPKPPGVEKPASP